MTITKEGALASFCTVNKAPIKHLKVYFSPKQVGEGDPSPENVREISGWSNIKILHGGINIFDRNNFIDKTYFFTSTGLVETDPRSKTAIIECAPNTTYTVYKPATNKNDRFSVGCSDHICDVGETLSKAAEDLQKVDGVWKTVEHKIVFQTNSMAKYLYIRYRSGYTIDRLGHESESEVLERVLSGMQIEVGENPKSYDEYEYVPYIGQTNTIDWTNDIGTVYGGYVDLVTGELVQTEKKLTLNGSSSEEWWEYDTYDQYKGFALNNTGLKSGTRQIGYASWMPVVSKSTSNNLECWFGVNNTIIYCASAANLVSYYDVANWRSYLAEHPLEIVIPLKNPITHQLTPTQLSTLIGRNNIWSNADRVEVEYDLAESNDELYRRRNILLRGYPHTESTNGNLVTFNTDVIGKFNEFKINFLPIQNKEGIPSFDNIKNIYGWTNLQTAQCQSLIPLIPTNFNPIVQNGMTLEYLDNNTFYLSGTLTETTNVTIPIQSFTVSNETFGIYIIFERYGASGSGSKNFYLGFLNNDKSIMGFTVPSNEQIVYTTYAYKENINDTINQMQILFTKGWQNVKLRIYLISGNSIRLSTNWSNLAQEIYGGYEDLTTVGTIVKSYNDFTIGGGNNLTIAGDQYCGEYGTDVFAYIPNDCTIKNYTEITDTNLFCDCFSLVKYGVWTHPDSNIGNATLNAQTQFHMVFNNANVGIISSDSANDRKIKISNYLNSHNVKVVYACNPTIVYQFTLAQKHKSLRGNNYIWTSSNGPINIKYYTH